MESSPRLRPMSIGDMLDAAFRLYRQHFLTFIGVVALLQAPMAMLQFLAQLPYMRELQRFTARPPVLGALRHLALGAIAVAVVFGVGHAIGTGVSG